MFVLALTLPLRGYASSIMLFCADAHNVQRIGQSAAHLAAGDNQQPHNHGSMLADSHQTDLSKQQQLSPDSLENVDGAEHMSNGSCSVCGECCISIVVGPTWPEFAGLDVSTGVIFFTPTIYVGVDLGRAERPPLGFILA